MTANNRRVSIVALFRDFGGAYPGKTAVMICALALAGLLEGLSVLALLPLLGMVGGGEAEPTFAEQVMADTLALAGLTPTIGVLLIIVVAGMCAKALMMLLAMRQVGYTVAHVAADLRHRMIQAVLRSQWGFFSARPIGGFANTISTEAERASKAYESACQVLALTIQTGVYAALAAMVSWQVSIFAVAVGGLLIALLGRLVGAARKTGREQTNMMQVMMAQLADGLRGIKPLKSMGRVGRLEEFLRGCVDNLNDIARQAILYRQALTVLQEPIIVLFLALGMFAAYEGLGMDVGQQIMLAVLFFRLVSRIGNVQQSWQSVMLSESAYWAILDTIDSAEAERECPHGGARPALPAPVRLESTRFAFPGKEVLRGVDLEITPGSIVTVIGPSGAGKSTLAELLIGLREPTAGIVRIGNLPLAEVDLQWWREQIGYVPQELFLFNDTILQNITLGDQRITRDDARDALEQAGAWDFVAALPDGLDSNVGESGLHLSGGQRQRIAIARALARRPAILILDEPTTALDPDTELAICRTVRSLAGGPAILAITHQQAWVTVADTVCRLQEGQVTAVTSSTA